MIIEFSKTMQKHTKTIQMLKIRRLDIIKSVYYVDEKFRLRLINNAAIHVETGNFIIFLL